MDFVQEAFDKVCDALGFSSSAGFIRNVEEVKNLQQRIFVSEAKEKLQIDAVYFIDNGAGKSLIPVVYFKRLTSINKEEILKLQQKIWSQGRIPVLFIITPTNVLIYNCYEPLTRGDSGEGNEEKLLLRDLNLLVDVEEIRSNLNDFSSFSFDTHEFWKKYGGEFEGSKRADKYLLNNLKALRYKLVEGGLITRVAHGLIGQSIFVKYLEDRGALVDFYETFREGKYSSFEDILMDLIDTYALFKEIRGQFKGDLFPISPDEEKLIKPNHLLMIRNFFRGMDMKTGQLPLWFGYSFDMIPIEFISNIYEEFLHTEGGNKPELSSAHFTPSFLVDFILDQTLPDNVSTISKILDPSCGSGIFLVSMYRRMIAVERENMEGGQIKVGQLQRILTDNIFGIDLNGEAIRVAAFSLYLTLVDYIEPKSIFKHKNLFPNLIGLNLFETDFLNENDYLKGRKFDLIVGNAPWNSTMAHAAVDEARKKKWTIGDRQTAEGFVVKALEFSHPETKICLILPAKPLLFNKSNPHRKFRRKFFESTSVETIINLSALRWKLFSKAVHPAAIFIFKPKLNSLDFQLGGGRVRSSINNIVSYVSPKFSVTAESLGSIVIDQTDIQEIPAKLAITASNIWKSAMWGTSQDWKLLGRLGTQRLLDFKRMGWEMGEGIQFNGNRSKESWMIGRPLITYKAVEPFRLDSQFITDLTDKTFYSIKKERLFNSPLCLVRNNPHNGRVVSAFYNDDVLFDDSIFAISGNKEETYLIKALVCIMNSSLAQYFFFLTTASWGVERSEIKVNEFLEFPMPNINRKLDLISELARFHDIVSGEQISTDSFENNNNVKGKLDKLVFDLYELNDIEREMIIDFVNYQIDFFERKEKSKAVLQADDEMLLKYAKNFSKGLQSMTSDQEISVSTKVHTTNKDLVVLSFTLVSGNSGNKVSLINKEEKLNRILNKLRIFMKERRPGGVYFSRFLKIYEGERVHFIKPRSSRFWTTSYAFSELEDLFSDLIDAGGELLLTE